MSIVFTISRRFFTRSQHLVSRHLLAGILFLSAIHSSACSGRRVHVNAQSGRPASAMVQEQVSMPLDRSKPRIVLAVEPFSSLQGFTTFASNQISAIPVADQLAAQLTTALSKVGNFQLYDHRRITSIKPKSGERGPYVLRAVITEVNENSHTDSGSWGIALGAVGLIAGIAGAVVGRPGLMWGGFGVAAASPAIDSKTEVTTGMVAFDVQIVEQRTGKIVASFDAAGTFTSESSSSSGRIFGIGGSEGQSASSAVGQALRAAMNDAVSKTAEELL